MQVKVQLFPRGRCCFETTKDLSFWHLWLKMTWKGRSADVRDLLVFLSLKKKNSSMSKGRRVRRSHLAWLRGENEIAWFSFAAKHTVSFSANVNKDRKRDHRGPPARLLLEASPSWSPSLGLCGLSHWKRTVFSHVGSPNSAALGKILLEPRDQRENDFTA